MLLSVVSILVVAQSSSEVPEGLMNNPVLGTGCIVLMLCSSRFRGPAMVWLFSVIVYI